MFTLALSIFLSSVPTTTPASAQEGSSLAEMLENDAKSNLEFRFTPGLYLPRLTGETRLGPSPAALDLTFDSDIDLNSMKQIPNIEFTILKDERWQLFFNGFDFVTHRRSRFAGSSDYGGLTLSPGDDYRAEFSMSSFALELSHRKWLPYLKHEKVDLIFSDTVGVRMYEIEQAVERPGVGREEFKEEYFHPYVGLQLDLHWQAKETISWLDRLEMNVGVFIGPVLGADRGIGRSIRASLQLFFTDRLSFLFGYRLYDLSIEDGEYELNGGVQGLFLGGTLRF